MTNVNRTLGSRLAVVVNGMNGYEKFGYGSKVGSGADRTPIKPIYATEPLWSFETSYNRVRKGKSVVVVKRVNRLRRYRVNKPPKRARDEEHPYSVVIETTDDHPFTYSAPGYALPYTQGLGQFGWGIAEGGKSLWTANHDLVLLGRLRNRVAGSGFNAGVALGEGREALDMITNSATRIYRALHAMRKGDVIGAQRELLDRRSKRGFLKSDNKKVAASNWLELQYGWLPLLQDAKDGAEFLAHQLSYPIQHVVRASFKLPNAPLTPSSYPYNSDGWRTQVCYTKKSIKAILREKDIAKLSGLTDPLSVAWELVPYSFVADWFIPISSYLSARGLSSALSGTFVISDYYHAECMGLKGGGSNKRAFFNADGIGRKTIRLNRSVTTSLPVPLPEVKPLASVPSWKRAANAVALLVNRFSGR